MANIKFNSHCFGYLKAVTIAALSSLVLMSTLEAQDAPAEGASSGTVQRVPSSTEPFLKVVDPSSQPVVTVPNDVKDEALGTAVRNPYTQSDPSLQIQNPDASGGDAPQGVNELSDPDIVFNGINSTSNPPDTVGDVGPNHYIQMANGGTFQVFEHDGTTAGPMTFDNLWPAGDDCRNGWGDPIVVYDHLADRWLMTQFAWATWTGNSPNPPYFLCFALSTSETPTNVPADWYLWTVNVGTEFPDYPKLGVWPDAYYLSTFEGDLGVFAMDRANMLNGNALQWVKRTLGNPPAAAGVRNTRVLPADLDGPAPPAGAPGIFLRTVEDSQDIGDMNDRIEIFEFDVDWANPAAATFTEVDDLRSADGLLDFEIMNCDRNSTGLSNSLRDCVPVPGTGTADALSNRPMMQLKYRNFGSHESMVVKQTVDVAPALNNLNPGLGFTVNNEVAGVRWYELRRNSGDTDWGIHQQGTFAPQNNPADEGEVLHRWMGSIAMDRFGNIALGYSISSDDVVFPGIRYAGRIASDPNGLLPQSEFSIVEGTTAPSGTGTRWGDYSTMSVDPADDCTFWYTTHIDNGEAQRTRVASFHFNDCSADLEVTKLANPDPATAGQQVTYTISVMNHGPLNATEIVVVDSLPDGLTYVADNVPGDQCDVAGQIITCEIGDLDVGNFGSFTITALVQSDILQVSGGPRSVDNLIEGSASEADDLPDNNTFTLSTLVNELADLSVTKTCKPDRDAVVGEDDPFCEIVISNSGPSMARDVTLNDEITANGVYTVGTVVTEQGSCLVVDGDVECDIGDIDAGDSVMVTVPVSALVAVDVNDIATVATVTPESDYSNNDATGQIHFVLSSADVLVTKQCQPVVPAMAETIASCEIFVYNNGPSTAENVVLDDQIASNGNYDVTAITTSAGSCSATGPNVDVSCDLGDMADGATVSIVVSFTSIESIDINDVATATSTTDDPDPNNNTATGSVTFVAVSDLSIAKQANLLEVPAGTNLIYTLTVINDGPSVAESVVVSDQVPAGVLMVSATPSVGSCVMGVPGNAAQPTLCGMGDFAVGQQETIDIEVAVLPDATGLLHNDATVSSDTLDDNNGNNQVTTDTAIIVVTDLWVTKTDDQDPVVAGTELKYVITVGNNGPSTATMVTLIDSLPAETSLVKTKVLGGAAACLQSGANPDAVTCTLADLGPGDTFIVVITVLVDGNTDVASITNLVEVFLDGVLDTSASEDTAISYAADLWIDKTGNFITENPSKTIRYTLTVHNDAGCSGDDPQVCGSGGPSDAHNVVVVDKLPSTNKKLRVSFVSEDCTYDYAAHEVTCVTPVLAAGDSVFFEIEAQPKGRLRAITNEAWVSSDTPDPDAGNNYDAMLIIVSGGGQK